MSAAAKVEPAIGAAAHRGLKFRTAGRTSRLLGVEIDVALRDCRSLFFGQALHPGVVEHFLCPKDILARDREPQPGSSSAGLLWRWWNHRAWNLRRCECPLDFLEAVHAAFEDHGPGFRGRFGHGRASCSCWPRSPGPAKLAIGSKLAEKSLRSREFAGDPSFGNVRAESRPPRDNQDFE